jgi:hypothetical protein
LNLEIEFKKINDKLNRKEKLLDDEAIDKLNILLSRPEKEVYK